LNISLAMIFSGLHQYT